MPAMPIGNAGVQQVRPNVQKDAQEDRLLEQELWLQHMIIKANVHSDDYRHDVDFEAVEWFETAEDTQLLDLIDVDFERGYAADQVAIFFNDGSNHYLEHLFDYVRNKDDVGFEVIVDRNQALEWLSQNRPHLDEYLIGKIPKGWRPVEGIGNRVSWGPPESRQ